MHKIKVHCNVQKHVKRPKDPADTAYQQIAGDAYGPYPEEVPVPQKILPLLLLGYLFHIRVHLKYLLRYVVKREQHNHIVIGIQDWGRFVYVSVDLSIQILTICSLTFDPVALLEAPLLLNQLLVFPINVVICQT